MAVEIATLSPDRFEELCSKLLEAEGFAVQRLEPRGPDRGVDFVASTDAERWAVACKTVAMERLLPPTILRLAAARKQREHELASTRLTLLTSTTVSSAFRKQYCAPLDIGVWDRAKIEELLRTHPAVARAFEEAQRPSDTWRAGALRLVHLSLRDFRNIAELELAFEPVGRVLVIAGPNGAGKSAVLQAIAVLLSWLLRRIANPDGKGYPFNHSDVRRNRPFCIASLLVELNGREIRWDRSVGGDRRSDMRELAEPVRLIRAALGERAGGAETSLPLAVYYPTNRAVLDIPRRIRTRHRFSPLDAYNDALSASNRDFRLFFEWFREREDLENERRTSDPKHRDRQLEAVREAISELLPGFTELRVRRKPLRMTVTKDDEELAVDQLSDGEKCLLAMVGDLARRLSMANPGRQHPLQGSAVVLIDEIELHLHPGWQRAVLPRLQAVFPRCQFVVTTHSPQVIASVDRSSVLLIDRGTPVDVVPHTKGRDASSVLSDLMGVPRYPREVEDRLRAISQLIEDEQFDEARRELAEWARERGDTDVEIVRSRAMIDFLEA